MKVVVIGGGFGGVKAAIELAKRGIDVTLISDKPYFLHHGLMYRAVTGHDVSQAFVPLKDITSRYPKIRLVQDTITRIDAKKRVAHGTKKQYAYDQLVVAVGLVDYFRGVHGAQKFSYTFGTEADAARFGEQFHDDVVAEGGITCAVIGGGLTGVELAGFLREHAERICMSHQIRRKPHIMLVEQGKQVLLGASATARRLVHRRLIRQGVDVKLGQRVERIGSSTMTIHGKLAQVDMTIWACGGQVNPLFRAHKNMFRIGTGGRVCVNQYLEAYPSIFVIGDSADTPHAGSAQTAVAQARFVARHIHSLHARGRPAYRPPETKPLMSIPVSRFWAYSERHGVYVAGFVGSLIRRTAELNSYCHLLPFSHAYRLWRRGRSVVPTCDLCADFREKT